MIYICTTISRKVIGESARDNPERYCGWFWVHCSSKKFKRMAREAIDICLWELKESNNRRFDSYTVSETAYWSYLILPFGIVGCTFFPTTFIEIAVCRSVFQPWVTPVQADAVFKVCMKKDQQWTQRGRDTSVRSKERYKTIRTNESMDSLKNKGRQTTRITTENLMSQAGKGRIISRRP